MLLFLSRFMFILVIIGTAFLCGINNVYVPFMISPNLGRYFPANKNMFLEHLANIQSKLIMPDNWTKVLLTLLEECLFITLKEPCMNISLKLKSSCRSRINELNFEIIFKMEQRHIYFHSQIKWNLQLPLLDNVWYGRPDLCWHAWVCFGWVCWQNPLWHLHPDHCHCTSKHAHCHDHQLFSENWGKPEELTLM